MTWRYNKLWGRHPATKHAKRSLGERSADVMKSLLATWTALIAVCLFIFIWILTNGLGGDLKPFILLNLCLSCFAALQCFVLLIANKRGEQISADIAQHTFENTQTDTQLLKENTELTRQVKENTDLLKDLHDDFKKFIKKVK